MSFNEEDIKKTFEVLKGKGDWRCFRYWKENPRFIREVEVSTGQDLELLLKQEPKLLTAR